MLVISRNRLFDFIEPFAGIFEKRIVAGAIRVLELLVRIVLRIRLFGMFFAPIIRFLLRIYSAALVGVAAFYFRIFFHTYRISPLTSTSVVIRVIVTREKPATVAIWTL